MITQPSPNVPLDYTPEALDEIVHLTHGQPYLIQLIGQNLVTQFNVTGLSSDAVTAALKTLCDHDVVIQEGDRLQFTVELMRRWVQQRS